MPPVLCAVTWTPRFPDKSGNHVSEFAIKVAPIHRTFQVSNSDMRCHLSSTHDETQSSDTCTPLGAFNPVGKSWIAISTHPVLSTPEKPKCRTPIQMDPRTRVLLINGSDCFGKSLIAIPFCKGPMSPETSDESNFDEPLAPSLHAMA
jgi:hypothetical protein